VKPNAPANTDQPKSEPKECDGVLFGRAKAERRPVEFKLIDGSQVTGMVINWSRFSVLIDSQQGGLTVVFKHSMVAARLLER
jgi:sRNA-binding regulator protein Hfq